MERPLVGLVVRRGDKKNIGANRVLLLVRGANRTQMEPVEAAKTVAEHTF